MNKRIVITGLGAVTSIGVGWQDFWQAILSGKSGISEIDAFDTKDHVTHYGGQAKNFDPKAFIDPKKIKLMSRASQLGVSATKLALTDAKLHTPDPARTALIMGTTGGEVQEIEEMDAVWVKHGHEKVDKWSILQYPVANITANIAREFKLKGKTLIFTTACAAGNYAIGYGYDLITLGKADTVICGGADAFSYLEFTGFNQVGAVAPQVCRPFDKNRQGMIPAEGSGVLILETLESALKRGVTIYAEILGYGLSCDASHMTNPDSEGVAYCMADALAKAHLKPEQVDYISAHGTGTIHNDRAESAAINKVFNQRKVPVSSIKSMLGHTMGAASALEAIACALTVKLDTIAPTMNFQTPDPECDVDCVPNKPRKQTVNVVLNNGFAFGGNNCCVAIKKYSE